MKQQCLSSSSSNGSDLTYQLTRSTVVEDARRIAQEAAHLREIAASLRSDARLTRELAETLRDLTPELA